MVQVALPNQGQQAEGESPSGDDSDGDDDDVGESMLA
jgi:hypothetical protein